MSSSKHVYVGVTHFSRLSHSSICSSHPHLFLWPSWRFFRLTVCMLSHSVMSDSLHPLNCSLLGSSCPWNSLSKNNGVGCHALLQGIFPTQGLTQVSCIAGGFFTVWTTREALKLPSSSLNWLEWILMDKVISNRDGFSGEGSRKLRLVVWLGWMWRHWGSNYDQRMELSSERCLNIYTQSPDTLECC